MYTNSEREITFQNLLVYLKKLEVEGVVQIGSGTIGYTDDYSDIDMMVAVKPPVLDNKDKIKKLLIDMGAIYIHEGMFREDIYLLIPFFENGLEIDISIMSTELLSVQSPLWKVVYDSDGSVLNKMTELNERFQSKQQPYRTTPDIAFQFIYRYRKAIIDLKRNNLIGALAHIDIMKEFILEIQLLNENQKLHQFKQYHILDQSFQDSFLELYQFNLDINGIEELLQNTMQLFKNIIYKNKSIKYDENIYSIIKNL